MLDRKSERKFKVDDGDGKLIKYTAAFEEAIAATKKAEHGGHHASISSGPDLTRADSEWHSDWARDDRDTEKMLATLERLRNEREAKAKAEAKPDYGLRLMQQGTLSATDWFFYDFRLFSLSVLGRGDYSTMFEKGYEGELYALSLNFNHAQLEQILAKADPRLAAFVRTEISHDPASPRSIDFEGHIVFGVRARLGPLQTAAKEQFVPLVAQEIL